jgi:hypothetical protein
MAEEIQGEMPQQGEHAGVVSDTAGVLVERGIQNMVEPIFHAPMAANGLSQGVRGSFAGCEVVGHGFLAGLEATAGGVEDFHAAANLDHGLEMVMSGFGAGPFGEGPDPRGALLDAIAAAQIHRIGLLGVRLGLTHRPDRRP